MMKQFLVCIAIVFLAGCEKEEVSVPAYISLSNFDLTTDLFKEGSASHAITDAWVYLDGSLLGIYPLPAKFPVMLTGNHKVTIYGGIKENGISNTRTRYPFYAPYEIDVDLISDQVYQIQPKIKYQDKITFAWKEDFEGLSNYLSYHSNSDTIVYHATNDVFEGTKSGHITLDIGKKFIEVWSKPLKDVPVNGTPVFFEMNVKTNHELLIGIYGDERKVSQYVVNKGTEWKKIYFNITDLLRINPNAFDFKVFIGALRKDDFVENIEIRLDNLKVVHFE